MNLENHHGKIGSSWAPGELHSLLQIAGDRDLNFGFCRIKGESFVIDWPSPKALEWQRVAGGPPEAMRLHDPPPCVVRPRECTVFLDFSPSTEEGLT